MFALTEGAVASSRPRIGTRSVYWTVTSRATVSSTPGHRGRQRSVRCVTGNILRRLLCLLCLLLGCFICTIPSFPPPCHSRQSDNFALCARRPVEIVLDLLSLRPIIPDDQDDSGQREKEP